MKRFQPVAQEPSPNRAPGIRPFTTDGENPKDGYGLAKVPLSLVPVAAKVMMAVGLSLGDLKYGAYNWRLSKVRLRVYIEAAMRHLDAILDGEEVDPESGAPHLAMLGANFAIIADAMFGGAGCVDDRPIAGSGGELIREMNDFVKEMSQLTKEAGSARSRAKGHNGSPHRGDGERDRETFVLTRGGWMDYGRTEQLRSGNRGKRAPVLQSVRKGSKRKPDKGAGRK